MQRPHIDRLNGDRDPGGVCARFRVGGFDRVADSDRGGSDREPDVKARHVHVLACTVASDGAMGSCHEAGAVVDHFGCDIGEFERDRVDSHDPAEQTHKVMQNIRQLIEEAGGEMAHLVKLVVYITDVRHRETIYRTMGEYIVGVHPVCTGLVVQALARPEWLVEIDATAVIPE